MTRDNNMGGLCEYMISYHEVSLNDNQIAGSDHNVPISRQTSKQKANAEHISFTIPCIDC